MTDEQLMKMEQETAEILGQANMEGLKKLSESSEKKENWVTEPEKAFLASSDGSQYLYRGVVNCGGKGCPKDHRLAATYTITMGKMMKLDDTSSIFDLAVRHLTVSVDGQMPTGELAMAVAFQLGFRPSACNPNIAPHPDGHALVILQAMDYDNEEIAAAFNKMQTVNLNEDPAKKEFKIQDLQGDDAGINQLERILIRPILANVLRRTNASSELTEVLIKLACGQKVENEDQVGISDFFLTVDKNENLKPHDKKLLMFLRKQILGF